MSKVAVTSRSFSRNPVLRAALLERYADVTFNDDGLSLRGQDLVDYLRGHDKAITALEPLTDELFTAVPELRVVGKYGVGLDMIDLHAMARHGVSLGWTGGVNRRSVSELVITFAVSLLRFVPQTGEEVRNGIWKQAIGRQLTNRTVGIIGCGHVGKDLAGILRTGFGCEVLVNDILDLSAFCTETGCRQVSLETLLTEADVVTLHLPLDPDTRDIVSAERLALMRSDAILINTARGGLIDEAALASALSDGRIAAAAFDVFAVEPPENMDLISLPNFMVTPHLGGSAIEGVLAMGQSAIEGLDTNQVPEYGVFPPGQW